MTPSHFGGNSTTSTTTQMTATPHITNYNKRWILAGSVIVFAVLRGLSMNPSFEGTALVASQEIPTDREIADPVLSESNSSNANNGSYGSSSDHGNIASLEVELISEDPLFCTNPNRTSSGQPECCSSWDVDVDDWWLHKPDWEVSRETEKVFCFAPIQNLDKASFLRQVHDRQYTHADCNKVETSVEMNSGFGASMRWLLLAFWHAHLAGNPFQIEWSRRRWLYSSGNQSSWAYCPSEDVACYYLPISHCSRNVTESGQHNPSRPNHTDSSEMQRFFWVQDYMMRPKQNFRRKQYELRSHLNITYPCTTMHVRRGDSGMPRPPFRRYAAVQEYIDKANIQKGANIVLLTDDESTIEEVRTYHNNDYNWIYLDRPRNRGIKAGFHGHFPSSDEGKEMAVIATELRVASTCENIVFGRSGFIEGLLQSMDAEGKNYTLHFLETKVSKGEALKFGQQARKRENGLFGDVRATIEATAKNRHSTLSDKNT